VPESTVVQNKAMFLPENIVYKRLDNNKNIENMVLAELRIRTRDLMFYFQYQSLPIDLLCGNMCFATSGNMFWQVGIKCIYIFACGESTFFTIRKLAIYISIFDIFVRPFFSRIQVDCDASWAI
jgi:hypothetical protein